MPRTNKTNSLEIDESIHKKLLKWDLSNDENESIDVAMSSLKTKHSGKKLTFLQQILGNIGVGGMGRGTIIGSGKADN